MYMYILDTDLVLTFSSTYICQLSYKVKLCCCVMRGRGQFGVLGSVSVYVHNCAADTLHKKCEVQCRY